MGEVGLWWPPGFSHDGDPSGLSLSTGAGDVDAGGQLLFVVPGRLLRSPAGLVPFDGPGPEAKLEWRFAAEAGGTRIGLRYRVRDRDAGDIADFAATVSAVLQAHVDGLAGHLVRRRTETAGHPPWSAQKPM